MSEKWNKARKVVGGLAIALLCLALWVLTVQAVRDYRDIGALNDHLKVVHVRISELDDAIAETDSRAEAYKATLQEYMFEVGVIGLRVSDLEKECCRPPTNPVPPPTPKPTKPRSPLWQGGTCE